MQILVAFFLAAIVGCYGNDDCNRKDRYCLRSIIPILNDESSTKEQYCSELDRTIECFTEATESCAGEPAEDYLRAMTFMSKDRKKKQCNIIDLYLDGSKTQKCIEENADYISECLQLGENEVNEKLANPPENKNLEDLRTCGLYVETVFCAALRIDEKCGDEVLKAFVKDIGDTPEHVQNACREIGVVIVSGLDDEDERKK